MHHLSSAFFSTRQARRLTMRCTGTPPCYSFDVVVEVGGGVGELGLLGGGLVMRRKMLVADGALPDSRRIVFKFPSMPSVHAVTAVFRAADPSGPEVTPLNIPKPAPRVLGIGVPELQC